MAIAELEPKLLSDLHMVAGELGIKNFRKYSKQDLIMKILNEQAQDRGTSLPDRVARHLPDGYGFLRTQGYTQSDSDIYVSLSQIRRFKLRRGDEITGQVRTPRDNEKYHALAEDPDGQRHRSRAGPASPHLRLAHAAVPRRAAAPGDDARTNSRPG